MIHQEQYSVVSDRRIAFDTLMWQTPVLSLTAMAFLFSTALSSRPQTAALMGVLIVLTSFASMQLLIKHRFSETETSKLLREFEDSMPPEPCKKFQTVHTSIPADTVLEKMSSYKIWLGVLFLFLLAGIVIFTQSVMEVMRWEIVRECLKSPIAWISSMLLIFLAFIYLTGCCWADVPDKVDKKSCSCGLWIVAIAMVIGVIGFAITTPSVLKERETITGCKCENCDSCKSQ